MSKPWLNHYTHDCPLELTTQDKSLFDYLRQRSAFYSDDLAFDIYQVEFTYRQFEQNTLALARALWHAGLRPGQKLGILLPNCPEYAEAFFAAQACGAIAVCLPEGFSAEKLQMEVNSQNIHTLFCLDKWAHEDLFRGISLDNLVLVSLADEMDVLHALFYQLNIFTHRDILHSDIALGISTYHEFIALGEECEWDRPKVNCDELACTLYTKAGRPIEHTHRSLIDAIRNLKLWFPDLSGPCLALQPFSNVFGLTAGLLLPLFKGLQIHLLPALDAKEIAACLHRHSYSYALTSPKLLESLNQFTSKKSNYYKELRFVLCVGDTLNDQVKMDFEQSMKCHITEAYGTTETAGIILCNLPTGDRIASVGIPLPSAEAAVFNVDNDEENPPETAGELIIKSPHMAVQNDDTKMFEGWFYTGDLAIMDQQGYFRISEDA